MQSITTKFIGPTNSRGSRVTAKTSGGERIILDWNDALGVEQNHVAAAMHLCKKLDWTDDTMVYGESPDGKGYTFVFVREWATIKTPLSAAAQAIVDTLKGGEQ